MIITTIMRKIRTGGKELVEVSSIELDNNCDNDSGGGSRGGHNYREPCR